MFKKGYIPWNKGKKVDYCSGKNHYLWKGGKPKCKTCGKQLTHYSAKYCRKHADFRSANLGKRRSPKTEFKKGQPSLGKRFGYERIMARDKHWNWKGGITPEVMRVRNSIETRLWREAVFARDNYTCVLCKKRGHKLNADHIKPFSLFPELRFAIDNGRTLCFKCHNKFGWRGSHIKNYGTNYLTQMGSNFS